MTSENAPLAQFNPDYPRCRAHRGVGPGQLDASCRPCSEAERWVQDRRQREEAEAAELARTCGMCSPSGKRWDPETHIPVSPATTCDHVTGHAAVLAAIEEQEKADQAALEARLAAHEAAREVPSTPAGRAKARAMYTGRPVVPAQRTASDRGAAARV